MESQEVLSFLNSYEPVFSILPRLNTYQLASNLKPFKNDWKLYNPRKPDYKRFGLSLTSLDGGFAGIPDLDSLKEYNELNKTTYTEKSFREFTPAARAHGELSELLNYFSPHVCRSHLIKFGRGGFFPPHRDSRPHSAETFRLFSLLTVSTETDYQFVINGCCYSFVPGVVYYINTLLNHSFVSFTEDVTILVLNIECSREAYLKLNKVMASC